MNNRIEQLTFTRFISAILIFLGHFQSKDIFFGRIAPNLWINFGVTYFFILSGFVLTYSYRNRIDKFDGKVYYNFMLSRLARVYPIYFFAMCLSIYVGIHWNHEVFSLSRILLNTFLLQAWNPPQLINFPSWSLSCELFFYGVFIFLLLKIKKVEKEHWLPLILVLYILELLVIIICYQLLEANLGSKLNPIFHALQFLIGIVAAFIHMENEKKYIISQKTNISIVIMLVLLMFFLKPLSGYEPESVPLYVFFILLVSHKSFPLANFFSKKRFVLLGNASFSLYILQGPLVTTIHKVVNLEKYITNGDIRLLVLATMVTAICVVLYIFIEKPLQRFIVKYFSMSLN